MSDEGLSFTFWAAEVKVGGKTEVKVGSPDDALHLTMACFGEDVEEDSRSVLRCSCNDRSAPIAVLIQGVNENQSLDLIISGSSPMTFTLGGDKPSPIFLSGFIQPLLDTEELGDAALKEFTPGLQSEPTTGGTKRQLSEVSQVTPEMEPPKKKMKEVVVESEDEDEEMAESKVVEPEPASAAAPEAAPPVSDNIAPTPAAPPVEVDPPVQASEAAADSPKKESQPAKPPSKKKKKKKFTYLDSGLGYRTIKKGKGRAVANGDTIVIRYIGQVHSNKVIFDKNLSEGLTFSPGQGSVIKGLDQGVVGMKVGEKRKILVPSDLAYGEEGDENIPANAELLFTCELIEVLDNNAN